MNKKIFISSLLIILSFFIGYFYKKIELQKELEDIKNKKYYIDIKKTKKNIKISNPNSNVIIFFEEKKLQNEDETILISK